MINLLQLKKIILSLTCFFCAFLLLAINCFSGQGTEDFPKTLDEAVNRTINGLSDENKLYIRSVPKSYLIIFHRGWGRGIRNAYGLWQNNYQLLESCAKKAGKKSIHPDSASSIIINNVWEKLNSSLNVPDFENLPPDNYFKTIHNHLYKAINSQNNNILASLPQWVYRYGKLNKEKYHKYEKTALRLLKNKRDESYLALLFLTSYYRRDSIVPILEKQINQTKKLHPIFFISHPSISQRQLIFKSKIVNTKTNTESYQKPVRYNWHNLSLSDIALTCLGCVYEAEFKTVQSYKDWVQLLESNIYLEWNFKDNIKEDELEHYIDNPINLLKIILLTKKFFRYDKGNTGMPEWPVREARDAFEYLNSKLNISKTEFQKRPYPDSLYGDFKYTIENQEYRKYQLLSLNIISMLADKANIENIIFAIRIESLKDYNTHYKTDHLNDYRQFVATLLVLQRERIIKYGEKDVLWGILEYNWIGVERLSWPLKYFITEMMFEVDPEKANRYFMKYFPENPLKGRYIRNGILNAMIKQQFDRYEDFIINWYWKIQNKDFNSHPHEREVILKRLQRTSVKTKAVYDRIINDKRYKMGSSLPLTHVEKNVIY